MKKNFFKRIFKLLVLNILIFCLGFNLCLPEMIFAKQYPKIDCLAPVVKISDLSLQQIFQQQKFFDDLKTSKKTVADIPQNNKDISEVITQSLLAKDVDIDYIGTILLAIDEFGEYITKGNRVLNALDAIVSYIHVFEAKGIDNEYIHHILRVLIQSDDTKNMTLIISDIDGAINISRLIKRFEQKKIPADYIKQILDTILNLDDAKQRSIELETLLSSPQLQFIGSSMKKTVSVLERIVHIDNLSAFIDRLKKAVTELPKIQHLIDAQTDKAKNLKQKGLFSRSIVTVCDKKFGQEIGTAFVVQENDNEYLLFTNNHVIDEIDDIVIKTSGLNSEIIGSATVVLSLIGDRRKRGDIALLSIKKENVRGAALVPIEISPQKIKDRIAVLIGSVNQTVSAGHFILGGDSGVLIGANSKPGDSGSPVLVETVGGYAAVAIHSAAGPMSILLTEEVKSSLLPQQSIYSWKIANKDREMFLELKPINSLSEIFSETLIIQAI